MAEVINLRQFKKQAARQAARTEADTNAVKFGRTKAMKKREAEDASRAKSALDGHKLED
ncbi:DUF4169 family protein [Falsigemmobacter faecalis]|uniref:DUF4169 family protein n=1 Tax=Falsigemmobacter faecalis TaxID=2488730 RepID=A0A3P3DHY6_9RHOB|nr:DUF4169 family protein [Falsigemmobacter faecalis]RRH72208.1 DUF4169 family protein [Falsigemmobacter faecalis]